MSSRDAGLAARTAEERRAFDESFARARSGAPAARESALRLAVGGDVYVVRLSQVGGVFLDRPLTRLPGSAKGFLGVAGIGASLVPVWDLRDLLGALGEELVDLAHDLDPLDERDRRAHV